MSMFIIRSFFGGEIISTTVTTAISLEAAKANFLAWCDPRCEGASVEACRLGMTYEGKFYAVQDDEYVVAYSHDFLEWHEMESDDPDECYYKAHIDFMIN